jgi:hypothetical protein
MRTVSYSALVMGLGLFGSLAESDYGMAGSYSVQGRAANSDQACNMPAQFSCRGCAVTCPPSRLALCKAGIISGEATHGLVCSHQHVPVEHRSGLFRQSRSGNLAKFATIRRAHKNTRNIWRSGPCFVEGQASHRRSGLATSMKTQSLFRLGAALKIAQDERSSSYSHRDLSSAQYLRYSACVTSLPRPRLHAPSSVRFQQEW